MQHAGPRGHDTAVLFSDNSRASYVSEAVRKGATYTFQDANDQPRTWLKGEYAYLATNAADLLLSRCNLKHDLLHETGLDLQTLNRYRVLLVPNAGRLDARSIEMLEAWCKRPESCLMVTGKTNLPAHLLGLETYSERSVTGYTGWRWLSGSPYASDAWEAAYVTGYKGHRVQRVVPLLGSKVLAELLEFTGDLSNAATATTNAIGPAIVATERTLYIANQVFELIGGMLQAHLNVEEVRHWANPTHWGDTILFFLRRLLGDACAWPAWNTRLRSFGTYDGVLSFRHDVHGMRDYTMLDYQLQNLIPASYDIEDPGFSTSITEPMALDWVQRTTRNSFIEPALHNDSSIGDPPTAVFGKGLFTHVINAEKSLGLSVCTCGRHAGGHMHPETIDAMDTRPHWNACCDAWTATRLRTTHGAGRVTTVGLIRRSGFAQQHFPRLITRLNTLPTAFSWVECRAHLRHRKGQKSTTRSTDIPRQSISNSNS